MSKTKNWELHKPNLEFISELPIKSSAWSGHYFFAYDLVANIKPKVIVELGTHKGNSLFSFAQAIKDLNLKTELHAIDTWEGDEHAGYYKEDVYEKFLKIKEKYYKDVNIIPHKMYFDEAVDNFKNNSIDILHIDGLHTYEAVKHDYENWLPKVNKKTGIILLHDVCEKRDDFGVYKLWDELKKQFKNTLTFEHYHGLGVLFLGDMPAKKRNLLEDFLIPFYQNKSKIEDQATEITDKEKHITNLEEVKNTLVEEKNRLEIVNNNLEEEKKKIEEEKNALIPDALEFREFKETKIWKGLSMYRKIKKYTKNFFINIYRDGPITTFKRIFKRICQIVRYRKEKRIDKNRYKYWVKKNKITNVRRKEIKKELENLVYKPLISIVMPVYNVDIKWIKEAIESITKQIYTNWELCIADDASTNTELIEYLKTISNHPKIKVAFREKNGHISEASNSALELATGEFVALMDNDDIIYPHALAEVVKVLNKKKDTDLIYSDEDKLTMKGERVEPFFKPDWSPDLFMSTNYLCHLTVIRKKLIDRVKGFRKGYEGSQDYDLFLRITEKTNNIEHIPDILYSWRRIPGSTAAVYDNKGYANKTSIKALKDAVKRRNLDATVHKGLFPGSFRVKYNIKDNPLVSILIPTKDKYEYIERCISSLLERTTYNNYEVLIIDTGSTEKETLNYYKTLKDIPKIRFLYWKKKFNYSAVNNFGVKYSKGEYILLLNNDTEVITPDWIEGMLEHAQREEIGAVGVKLYYPNNTIQHAGVVLGIGGSNKEESIAAHIMSGFSREIIGIPYARDLIRNYSAVTAACLMISREKYEKIGKLNEKLRIAFNDVDFNLKLMEEGYNNIFTPYVELYHHESISVGKPQLGTRDMEEFKKEINYMKKKWNKYIINDPFYNRNLTWKNLNCDIRA
ncbi:glycosyltransferase [Candidatus Dojkabacteria bacterium]|uniref:Glycosyltransferase n=1 Tax=Candidatus Dojkabacteria bacterium TaxID=2099670 RepID=A0A847VDW5_9BACT|nr:glycosyltransferase [Candidatus Dojkabacteria bacterium]